MKKFRATLVLDIDTKDFMEAGKEQQAVEKLADDLATKYTKVTVDFRERRDFKVAATGKKQKKTAKA